MTTLQTPPPAKARKIALEYLKSAAKNGRMAATNPDVAAVFAAFEGEFTAQHEAAALDESLPTTPNPNPSQQGE